MSEEITVTRSDHEHFGVEVRQGSITTSHRVRLTAGRLDDLGVPAVDHEDLVRESFGFLLEVSRRLRSCRSSGSTSSPGTSPSIPASW